MIHEKGFKGDRDRTMLLSSYNEMVRVFRVPRKKQLTAYELSRLTNHQLYHAANDLYVSAPRKKQAIMAARLGMAEKPETVWFKMWSAFQGLLIDIRMWRASKRRTA